MPDWGWLFLAYVSGSVVTGWMVWRSAVTNSIAFTVDNLVKNGFLRYRRMSDGEIEILKYDHVD